MFPSFSTTLLRTRIPVGRQIQETDSADTAAAVPRAGAAGRALDKLTPAAREAVGRATQILIRAYQGREWAILIRAYQGRECRTVLALFVSEPDELGFGRPARTGLADHSQPIDQNQSSYQSKLDGDAR